MKKILLILISLLLFSCKSREKSLQKTETETDKESKATAKIEDKTFEIVSSKELSNSVKANISQSNEAKKDETKDVQIIREYYENGNLKSEIQKSFSQLSEATKYAIEEMREELTKEQETSKYWENSSNHYYQLWQQELSKSKTKDLTVKSKPTFTWQMFFVGLIIGWLVLPLLWRWFKSWLLRFNPYLKFLEWLHKQKIAN